MAIKAVAWISNFQLASGGASDVNITVTICAGIAETFGNTFGPYAQNVIASSREAALKADIMSYCTATFGTSFGLLDTVQLLGGALDL